VIDWADSIVRVSISCIQEGVRGDHTGLAALVKGERVFLHIVDFKSHEDLARVVSNAHVSHLVSTDRVIGLAELPLW